jgi:hypothetical protein
MEVLVDAEIVSPRQLESLMREADELISIIVASVKTIKRRRR